MRIAMIGAKGIPYPGGIENVVYRVASRLAEKGHEVTAYVRRAFQPNRVEGDHGIRVVPLPSVNTKNLDAITYAALASADAVVKSYDIVHYHAIGMSPFSLFPRFVNMKTVVTTHGLDWKRSKWGGFARAYLRACDYSVTAFPNATTTVSLSNKKHYERSSGRCIRYIPNGIESPNHLVPNAIRQFGLEGDDYVLFMARLVPEKGCHYLLDAFNAIDAHGLKLVIAGDDDHGGAYAKQLRRVQNDRILFTGYVGGALLDELLSNAYLYVLPSELEGFSTGLLEAASHGRCILASDIEENTDALGEAGIYFESANVASLQAKLARLVADPGLIAEYRHKVAAYASGIPSWDEVASMYESVYSELLS